MRKLSIIVLLTLLLTGACTKAPEGNYRGKKMLQDKEIRIDSMLINCDTTSTRGFFAMKDSAIIFLDIPFCRIFEFGINSGALLGAYSQRGQGPGDMLGVMDMCIIGPEDTTIWIVDGSFGVYDFSTERGGVSHKGRLDFSWSEHEKNDYNHPSVYKFLEPSYCPTAYQLDDTTVIIPVSIADRLLKGFNSDRYKEGHFLGLIDTRSLKVRDVAGSFPESYLEQPTPNYEASDFTVDKKRNKLYVTFAADPLIYCYDLKNLVTPLYSFGYDPEGIDRDYTIGYPDNMEDYANVYYKDNAHVGYNSRIYYDATDDILLRTTYTGAPDKNIKLQVYKDNNLIQEHTMPRSFRLLGRYGDKYYGIRASVVENDDECYFVIYSFTL